MSEQTEIETPTPAPAPKKQKRKVRRHKRPNKEAAVKIDKTEFPGISDTACCTTCRLDHCVISGVGVCAHPLKGGLQSSLSHDPEAFARFNRAKKVLAKAKIDRRGD